MIYTDRIHLVADSLQELHQFAKKIGLKREWFQDHRIPHYDLFGSMKKKAEQSGAIVLTTKEIIAHYRKCK